MIFDQINTLDFFSIKDEFGSAELMKTGEHECVCISSKHGTYEKARFYYLQLDTKVYET